MSNGAHERLSRYLDRLDDTCEKHDQYVTESRQLLADWTELHQIIDEMADTIDQLEAERDEALSYLYDDPTDYRPVQTVDVQESML